jgi:hypothetical protein
MSNQIATGNHDATGKINGIFYKGQSVAGLQGKTLVATTDVTIGGCCVFRDKEWIQESYQDGYGDWANVVTVPCGSMFSVDIINYGDLQNMAEVKVTQLN